MRDGPLDMRMDPTRGQSVSPADFGPKLLEVIKEHFPQDVK